MEAVIEEYKEEDFEALVKLIGELQDTLREFQPDVIGSGTEVAREYSRVLVEKARDKRGKIFFAKEDGRAVGVAACHVVKEPDEREEYLYISDLAVAAPSRGKGIGTELLKRAEEYARGMGTGNVRLSVLTKNEKAARLYQTCGYEDFARILRKKLSP